MTRVHAEPGFEAAVRGFERLTRPEWHVEVRALLNKITDRLGLPGDRDAKRRAIESTRARGFEVGAVAYLNALADMIERVARASCRRRVRCSSGCCGPA